MSSTTFSLSAAQSDVVSIAGLSTVGISSYSVSSSPLIDNTPANVHGLAYINGLLRLSFSSVLTAGSGTPYVQAYLLYAVDGTNLPNPPGAAAESPALNQPNSKVFLTPTAAFQILDFELPDLKPFPLAFLIYNASGVAFSGTVTATLERWNIIGG